jgi:hypothetical protein
MSKHPGGNPKGGQSMTHQSKLAMVMASVAVAAMVSAPVATALPNCQTAGDTTQCRTNGSVSIKARPGSTAPPANQPQIPWFVWR